MRIETHFHCSPASPCAVDTPHAMLAEAARQGIDAVFLTDHGSLATWDALLIDDIPDGLLVCPGVECSVSECSEGGGAGEGGDVLVLADSPDILRALDTGGAALPSVAALAAALAPFPRERYFLSWAHPMGNASGDGGLSGTGLALLALVDALEAFNGNHGTMAATSPHIFSRAELFRKRYTAGSDAHAVREVSRAVTVAAGTATDAAGVVRLLREAPLSADIRRPAWMDEDAGDLGIRFE